MKKLLISLFVLILPLMASVYDAYIDGIYYNLNTSTKKATVTYGFSSYNSYSGSVVIPASITNKGVTYNVNSIGDYAFAKCTDLTSVEIPSSVTSIGNYSFDKCTSLPSITINNTVTSIGNGTFARYFNEDTEQCHKPWGRGIRRMHSTYFGGDS